VTINKQNVKQQWKQV